jgi:hypothetical protein
MWYFANKHSFNESFPAGREADGRRLFVTQTVHGLGNVIGGGTDLRRLFDLVDGAAVGVTIDDGGNASPYGSPPPRLDDDSLWHIGKAGTHLARGVTYSYGGKEYDSTQHFVFAPPDPQKYSWVAASNGHVPPQAVAGWNRRERQLVARAAWEGGVHPGKLIPGSRACFIGYGGGEKGISSYEVLVLNV